MKLKTLFLLLVSTACTPNIWACGGSLWNCDHNPGRYLFSTTNRNEITKTNYEEQNIAYWQKLTGGKLSTYEVKMQLNNTGDMSDGSNKLLNLMKERKNKEAVEYLEKLKEMKKVAANSRLNSWNYPSKAQLEQNKKDWLNILNWAQNKLKGKRTQMNSRYVLMAMRAAFYAGKDDVLGEIWLSQNKNVREPDLKNQCEGYMAAQWIKSGWTEKARDYYIKAGRITDLRASFPQGINTKVMKEVFDKYPESKSFNYIIQDFLNNHSSDLLDQREMSEESKKELKTFVNLAGNVVKSGSTKNVALWLSGRGYALYLLGEKKAAISDLQQAMKVKCDPRTQFNTRALTLVARADNDNIDAKFEAYLTKELTWLRNASAKNKTNYDSPLQLRNHWTDVFNHVVYDILIPRYNASNHTTTVALLANAASELTHTQNIYDRRCTILKRDSTQKGFNGDYTSALFRCLDTIRTESVINYYSVVNQGGGTAFEQSLVPLCYTNESYICDIIATKLMREFKFKQAMDYLKKVEKNAALDMNTVDGGWLGRPWQGDFWKWNETKKKKNLAANKSYAQKMAFCKQMMKMEENISKAQSKQKMDAKYAKQAYDLACCYFNASLFGKCWAMTEYSKSSYIDSTRMADDAYLKRAKTLLRSAYSADKSEANMTKCLAALFYIGQYSPSNDHDKMAKMLWKLKDTPSGSEFNIGNCDLLANYLKLQ